MKKLLFIGVLFLSGYAYGMQEDQAIREEAIRLDAMHNDLQKLKIEALDMGKMLDEEKRVRDLNSVKNAIKDACGEPVLKTVENGWALRSENFHVTMVNAAVVVSSVVVAALLYKLYIRTFPRKKQQKEKTALTVTVADSQQ